MKKIVYDRGMGKYPIYRMDCYDVVNASLMELCKNGNKRKVSISGLAIIMNSWEEKILDTFLC
ncbi:MAG: hypothetical protein ACLRWA_06230 [Lachnospira sp.]